MTPHPGPWSVVLIDNAQIHHYPDVIELVESYGTLHSSHFDCSSLSFSGCHMEYLPPYLPDFILIEQGSSVIKYHLCPQGVGFYNGASMYFELYDVCSLITPEMTWGFFHQCGYYVG